MNQALAVLETATGWLVTTANYQLEFYRDRPRATLRDSSGRLWTDLSLIAAANRVDLAHEVLAPVVYLEGGEAATQPLGAQRLGDVVSAAEHVEFVVRSESVAWHESSVIVTCKPERVSLKLKVVGSGRLGDVTLGGGRAVLPSGACGEFRSSIGFRSVFVPTPTEPIQPIRPAHSAAQLGVVGDAEPGRLHGIFSPPPLVFGFGRDDAWLAASVVADVEDSTFTWARYEPLDGGWLLRLPYEGHTEVAGEWTSSALVLTPVASHIEAITEYTRLVAKPSLSTTDMPKWWLEPIFCGWGAQCAAAAEFARSADATGSDAAAGMAGFIGATAGSAPALARQANYDHWLDYLAEHGVTPGTVVIDDQWQLKYGTCEVNTDRWPDLKGWIARRHKAGQRVLLWFKAWDPSGLSADECITDVFGRPVAVDVTNPKYQARLREMVTWMLSPAGLNADGFKFDFTQRAPSGQFLQCLDAQPTWGIAALYRLLKTVYEAAKAAKPDALIVNHTVNPQFADVTDMIRLNDVLERDPQGNRVPVVEQLRFRAEVAAAAVPGTPIDTDQWPMPNRDQWLVYNAAQVHLGVPALYYVQSIDNSGEPITTADLAEVARLWAEYRARIEAAS